jgi:hypothetical protein
MLKENRGQQSNSLTNYLFGKLMAEMFRYWSVGLMV